MDHLAPTGAQTLKILSDFSKWGAFHELAASDVATSLAAFLQSTEHFVCFVIETIRSLMSKQLTLVFAGSATTKKHIFHLLYIPTLLVFQEWRAAYGMGKS